MLDRPVRAGRGARQAGVAAGRFALGAVERERAAKLLLDGSDLVVVIVGDDFVHALGARGETRPVRLARRTLVGVYADVILAGAVLVAVVRDHGSFFLPPRRVAKTVGTPRLLS